MSRLRVFLDANILVSVINREFPAIIYTQRILSLTDYGYHLNTSTLSLAIAFYFAEKKFGNAEAIKKIRILMNHLHITDCSEKEAKAAINNVKANDFEDALQYFSAVNAYCDVLVTMDVEGFYYADIPILTPEKFWDRFVR
jgi:predicted nucleic acid-binding protein